MMACGRSSILSLQKLQFPSTSICFCLRFKRVGSPSLQALYEKTLTLLEIFNFHNICQCACCLFASDLSPRLLFCFYLKNLYALFTLNLPFFSWVYVHLSSWIEKSSNFLSLAIFFTLVLPIKPY